MERFWRTDEWKINDMSPDELLAAHDNLSRQIDRLKLHWTHLNQSQTKIMTRYHELQGETASEGKQS